MIKTLKTLAFLLHFMIFYGGEVVEPTQFKILRGNGKTYTSTNIQRGQDLEYPRKDSKILKVLHENWEVYYACLIKKEKQETKPEIRRLLEGQNTELECDFCSRPFQNYEEIQWKYKPLSPDTNVTELDYLDLTPEMSLTPKKTLQIFNAMESFAGLYVCFHGKSAMSVYVLEVSKNDTTEKVEKQQTATDTLAKFGYTFNVHYIWTSYTECSTCGRVGKKYKYGTCYVTLIQSPVNRNDRNPRKNDRMTVDSSGSLETTRQHLIQKRLLTQINRRKTKTDYSTLQDEDGTFEPEIFEKFSNGIPCASPYLMKIDSVFSNKYTPVKVIVKYCWEPCQETKIFEVIDNLGRVVEIANNTAGIYSLFQELPNVPPGIERSTVVADFGSTITISCPGTSLTNTPVTWKVNDKIIFPDIVSNQSHERFTVDLVNRIHIKKLRLNDGKIYSCWQKEKLVGTVHLNVEKKFKVGFNHHVTLIGILAIIGTFLLVGSKMLTRELTMRKK